MRWCHVWRTSSELPDVVDASGNATACSRVVAIIARCAATHSTPSTSRSNAHSLVRGPVPKGAPMSAIDCAAIALDWHLRMCAQVRAEKWLW
mmetsp:Transcript_70656/g.229555  ORF Transcript_70656/g.229555 Transcript_70656/m.229555 type:complete len:92 (+) Transcript_70656:339-614(+)